MTSHKTTYKGAGVDIAAGDTLVDRIKSAAKGTKRMEVISDLGGFAGYFSLTSSKVKNPVLVAATDGVGTKLKIAIDMGRFDSIGQDLVAMSVNDLICCGAEPLFFLDYYATGKLAVEQAATVITGIARALKEINCALLGGETAEMPGMYRVGDFDLAGFAVGIVDRNKIIEGAGVRIGDAVIGIVSSGFHSNGYSLVRRVIEDRALDLNKVRPATKKSLGEELLAPTTIYVNPVMRLLRNFEIRSMAHITGGGLVENLPRVLPKKCKAVIDAHRIKTPPLFRYLQDEGRIPEDEMWRVFNMGIGFVLVVKDEEADSVLQQLKGMRFEAARIGVIAEKKAHDHGVELHNI
jgi:phosphoribosylformylglycinamidine cyclo-ligase